jgi:HD-like signal output (HDOD) protein
MSEREPQQSVGRSGGSRGTTDEVLKRRIGELLVDEGIVTPGQLRDALALQSRMGGKVVANLIQLGYLDSRAFVDFLARQPGTPSIGLTNYVVSQDLINLVPKAFAVKNEVFPIDKMGRLLTVGMVCPLDSATIYELEEHTGLRVKALLCPPDDIRNAIRRYYPEDATAVADEVAALGSTLRLEGVAKMVRALNGLPGLPDTVERVRAAMDEPDISMSEIADVIARDPAIAAGLLRLANSAAYGFSNRVDSVQMAAKLLGLRETYMVVVSSAVIDLFKNAAKFDYKKYWRRSAMCGMAAKVLAEKHGEKRASTFFTAGLLAKIGQLALAEVVPERYAAIDENLTGLELAAEEEAVLGLSYTEAGYELGSNWKLPDDLLEAIRFHNTPAQATTNPLLVAAVSVASVLADAVTAGKLEDPLLLDQCAGALKTLGLAEQDAMALLKDLPRLAAQRKEE